MQINCIIIEDEPLAQERIKNYVSKLSFLNLLASLDNSLDAMQFLKTNAVDLIFLDINLGELSGLQLLETLHVNSEVIITTAYDEYALKGFELNVTDYLLKPFTFERFLQAVNRAQDNLVKKESGGDKKFIFIKTEYRLEKVLLTDIIYIEGMRDYRKIHTIDKPIMTLQTFTALEDELPQHIICRVHKSYMIAIDKIDAIEKDSIRIGKIFIPISDTYKKPFLRLINK